MSINKVTTIYSRSSSKKQSNRIKEATEDRILYSCINIILFIFVVLVAYPLIYVLSSSFSSPRAVISGKIILFPVDFSLEGYEAVFSHRLILSAYRNTVFYTVLGTLINLFVTMTCAYPLSRRDFPLRKAFNWLFLFTMFFSGGLIPTYILMTQIKFVNTIWVMLIPGALSVYNMFLARTFLSSSIPNDLLDASQIDGCSDTSYFFRILLPLSKPIIAVLTLFYAVGHWNAYFSAMMYLSDRPLFPLQLVLREILIASQIDMTEFVDVEGMVAKQGLSDLLKYSLIVVATVPILCVYPFIQKYFIKGVMLGSIKG